MIEEQWYNKLYNLLEFQEKSANKIKLDESHDDHTEHFDERYWHGFEVAMRYSKNRLRDWIDYKNEE